MDNYIIVNFDESEVKEIIMMNVRLYEELGNIEFAIRAISLLKKISNVV